MTLPIVPVTSSDVDFLTSRKIAPSLHGRILMERAIVRRTAEALIAAGYVLRLHDGEEWSTPKRSTVEQVMDACMATDEERLYAFTPQDDGPALTAGWVFFVYGNDGWDVISDYSLSLEEALKPANDLGDQLAEGAVFTVTTDRESRLESALRGLCNVAVWDEDTDRSAFDKAMSEALALLASPTTSGAHPLQAAFEELREAIRRGPQQVIGYDRNGVEQKAFEHGWNAKAEYLWAVAKGLVPLPPNPDAPDFDPDATMPRPLNAAALADAQKFAAGLRNAPLEG